MEKEKNLTSEDDFIPGSIENDAEDMTIKELKSSIPFSIEGKLIHVKVGTKDEPATPNYLEEVEKDLKEKTQGINCIIFVTPHDIEISTY